MFIKEISISNFRNLNNINIVLNEKINYIVGDNKTGKSNFLILLDRICNSSFKEEDYFDKNEDIVIKLVIGLTHEANNIFENECSVSSGVIKIKIKQSLNKEFMAYDIPSKRRLEDNVIKRIVFDVYKSYSAPNYEFDKNNLLEKIIIKNDFLNLSMGNVANFETHTYLIMASFLIYKTILKNVTEYSRISDITYKKNHKRILPLIIALDEPEVHLNAYLQRSVINYYKRILNNEDEFFLKLIKEEFNIDEIYGQLIIVTHSSEALVDDYKSILRFYKENNELNVLSGADLKINEDYTKHLMMMFPFIKEAFFCKRALVCEGITEYGAFKGFAKTLGIDLDKNGVCLINAMGEGSVSKLKPLLDQFKIRNICVYDRDIMRNNEPEDDVIYTKEACFEIEIVSHLVENKKQKLLTSIAQLLPNYLNAYIDYNSNLRLLEKIGYVKRFEICKLSDLSAMTSKELLKALYFIFFYKKKGILLGKIIGEMLGEDDIPSSYKKALRSVVKK